MLEWLWGSSDKSKSLKSQKSGDPFKELEPSLKDFLKAEAPQKYEAFDSKDPPKKLEDERRKWREQIPAFAERKERSDDFHEPERARVPPQSTFPDGRYAHLWKTYTPMQDIENSRKSDQDKILDVLDLHKSRKEETARVALENCSIEQIDYHVCLKGGTITDRMTMCRSYLKKLERCYIMQTRILKALGYLNLTERGSDLNERIQMHGDRLYHEMLDQEKAMAEAKVVGKPAPPVPPLLTDWPKDTVSVPSNTTFKLEDLSEEKKAVLRKRFANLTPSERVLEEKAVVADLSAALITADRLQEAREVEQRNKKARKEKGEDTIRDKISSLFGW
ncbi:MAG: hypothetical protein M1814_002437 [Vezdaea aestivalis]|nr:MAG: hypothetical protein M1814_002437 [Vezdaea aestivalis]